jgi:hypothetical protein
LSEDLSYLFITDEFVMELFVAVLNFFFVEPAVTVLVERFEHRSELLLLGLANEILKQAALGYMASQLVGKSEKEKLATMFKSFDKNGDGRLDKKEIQDGYKKFHHKLISDEEVA